MSNQGGFSVGTNGYVGVVNGPNEGSVSYFACAQHVVADKLFLVGRRNFKGFHLAFETVYFFDPRGMSLLSQHFKSLLSY
jgi:hypothetical protein